MTASATTLMERSHAHAGHAQPYLEQLHETHPVNERCSNNANVHPLVRMKPNIMAAREPNLRNSKCEHERPSHIPAMRQLKRLTTTTTRVQLSVQESHQQYILHGYPRAVQANVQHVHHGEEAAHATCNEGGGTKTPAKGVKWCG